MVSRCTVVVYSHSLCNATNVVIYICVSFFFSVCSAHFFSTVVGISNQSLFCLFFSIEFQLHTNTHRSFALWCSFSINFFHIDHRFALQCLLHSDSDTQTILYGRLFSDLSSINVFVLRSFCFSSYSSRYTFKTVHFH